jgi:hypothetical protein
MCSGKEEAGIIPHGQIRLQDLKMAYLISVCRTLSVLQPSDNAESLQTTGGIVLAHRISFQQDKAAYHFAPENC